MNDILYINKFHEDYIHADWLRELCRNYNIVGYTTKTKQELLNDINQKIISKDLSINVLEKYLKKWMYQGRKKLAIQFIDEDSLSKIKRIDDFKLALDKSSFIKSDKLKSIFDFKTNVSGVHLIDIEYVFQNEETDILSKAVFFFIKIVYSNNDGGEYRKTPYPVYVSIDFDNYEVICRVNAKSNLQNQSGIGLKDYNVARKYLQEILLTFNLIKIDDVIEGEHNKRELIFDIYKNVTKIPEYIYERIHNVKDIIDEFTNNVKAVLELKRLDIEHGSFHKDIYNLLVKEYIAELPEEEKKSIINNNFAYVTSITARGNSHTLRQTCPLSEAIQLVLDFHNIISIIDIDRDINNNVFYWKSEIKEETWIRSKLLNVGDVLLLSIEESAIEEEIENVLSKIREYK